MARAYGWLLLVFALGVSLAACGDEDPDALGGTTPRRDAGRAADVARLPDGAIAPVDPDGPPPPVTPDAGQPALTPDASCAQQDLPSARVPGNILILLDRSGSMIGTKWEAARRGVTRMITALSDDTRVGLMFFPGEYTNIAVPVAPLATSRTQIINQLLAASPSGGTPMACAMQGAASYWMRYDASIPGSRNVVLITDGAPSSTCGAGAAVTAAVQEMAMRTPPVRTFVIGTPEAVDTFLSDLATRGLTPRSMSCAASNACHYSMREASFETDLNAALDEIRGRSASCELRIMVDAGMADPGRINVVYTPGAGGTPRTIPRDTSHTNGWDYSPDMRSIILYGAACDDYRTNTMGGSVQVLFGCPTVTPG